ncbi:MAG TPA: ABC transporter permease [Anaerolineales bacterium]|nr:ABC transporter permease [Anaerolineales bacterium]
MRLTDLIRLVFTNLSRARARAALSASGVVIGAAAVVILISLATGVQNYTTRDLSSIGPLNEITIISLGGGGSGRGVFLIGGGGPDTRNLPKLTPKFLNQLARRDDVAAVMARERLSGGQLKHKQWQSTSGEIYGVDASALSEFGLPVKSGDVDLKRWQVAVGAKVGESFYDPRESQSEKIDPIDLQGKTLTITISKTDAEGKTTTRTVRVTVAGVLAPRGGDTDYAVYLRMADYEELNTWLNSGERANRREKGYGEAVVLARSADEVSGIVEYLQNEGFIAFSSQQILSQINRTFSVLQAFVGGIGIITLAISGTGIANTLITAIYERTREIGLMKAVGATDGQVMSVFLGEAAAIGGLGGLGGLAVGWLVSVGVNLIVQQYYLSQLASQGGSAPSGDVVVTPLWLCVVVPLFATAMGVLAGIYPARRAASLDPVEALRAE